jgi:hypothetical protein
MLLLLFQWRADTIGRERSHRLTGASEPVREA